MSERRPWLFGAALVLVLGVALAVVVLLGGEDDGNATNGGRDNDNGSGNSNGAASDGRDAAEAAMFNHYQALADGQFAEADTLYGGDYGPLTGYNPDVDPDDGPMLLQRGCTMNGFVCLPVLQVVDAEQQGADGWLFTVEYEHPKGGRFEVQESEASGIEEQVEFPVEVNRVDGEWRVMSLPVYLP